MARTIKQIQDDIIAAKNADATLSGLTSTSATAVWRLWTYVVAFCFYTIEVLFDALKAAVAAMLADGKVHTLRWYELKALEFQDGITLPRDTDVYPSITTAALIVTHASAEEITAGTATSLQIKVAKGTGPLAPLDTTLGGELDRLNLYFKRIKDAGVKMVCVSYPADQLFLKTRVIYNPLVLDATGTRIDGTAATPIKDKINAWLLLQASTNFDGKLVLNELVNEILAVDGVFDFTVVAAQAITTTAVTTVFVDQYRPYAGYLELDVTYFDGNVVYVV